ncbi:hypothetical protein E5D57_001612 [Metarhizium anisopliae]|nr:hypothetical protein E5D57_001612 [Metarhizium anisopliae]
MDKMDDPDLTDRIYTYSTEGIPFYTTKTISNPLSLALPLHQEAQTLQYGCGLGKKHFSITFGNQQQLLVKDLDSLYGAQVTYDDAGAEQRRRFQRIIGGDRNADEKGRIVAQIHEQIQFKIIVVDHGFNPQPYEENVKK